MISPELAALYEELEKDIKKVYEEGVTLDDAEKLAAKFLGAQITLAQELKNLDLDARMRKTGVKSIRAAVYLSEVQKVEKKPSDTLLEQLVNSNELVNTQQEAFDTAEVDKDLISNYLNIARDGHIFFRGVSKGRFE